MAVGDTEFENAAVIIGADGFATLALSCVVMLLSAGVSLLGALSLTIVVALSSPASARSANRLLVLGMRLGEDGGIPALYRRRLDRARAALSENEGDDIVILGGRTRPGLSSEAAAGEAYLRRQGVPAAAIALEDASRHTLENLRLYRARFADARTVSTALVSNRFHLARCGLMAGTLGLTPRLCAAEADRRLLLADSFRLLREAFLVHWYIVGRGFARLTRNRRMLGRISQL